ncbi:MAG TPA: LysM domain-containing protein [Vicinamibacterales bacterium]|nr:LysM domain-containing protein [Vicinamibacterales bacterium]
MAMLRLANGRIVNTNDLNWSPSAGGGSMYDATRLGAAPFAPLPAPPPMPGLTTRRVTSVPIGPDGNPVVGGRGQSAAPANPPRLSFFDFIRAVVTPNPPTLPMADPTPPVVKDQSRLPTGTGLTFDPEAQAAQDAELLGTSPGPDLLTGSGRSTLLPFPMPASRQPRFSDPTDGLNGAGPQYGSAFRPESNGWGSNGFTYAWMNNDITAPSSPPPVRGTLGPITFRKGDTVSKLAKARGMTVTSFADLYGIANPNRIYAGRQGALDALPASPA